MRKFISTASKKNPSTSRLMYPNISLFLFSPQLSNCSHNVLGILRPLLRSKAHKSNNAWRINSFIIFAPPLIIDDILYTKIVLMGPQYTSMAIIRDSMYLSFFEALGNLGVRQVYCVMPSGKIKALRGLPFSSTSAASSLFESKYCRS